ncbi:hypothetical protein IAU60_001241 [Kwoniella sp. DSM 27419]
MIKVKLPPSGLRTALLHQGAPVPAVNGVVKPMKPGGYADGCADIAFALQSRNETVITPERNPRPTRDLDWSFPDTVKGIRDAIDLGANVIWANTILHTKHAIVTLRDELEAKGIRVVGVKPSAMEKFDDKEWTNRWLASHEGLKGYFPRAELVHKADDPALAGFPLPAVVKPVRGRGSHGVMRVTTVEELQQGVGTLLGESDAVLVEEYLSAEEITVTVMPSGTYSTVGGQSGHWALPVVTRFDQKDGVAPWNGTVPVINNSRVLTQAQHDADPAYAAVQDRCALVAKLCGATSAIRIDCRRKEAEGPFFLFDVNMKPNAGGPGRPGRDTQAALTTMSASEIGWDWPEFACNLLRTARPVQELLED